MLSGPLLDIFRIHGFGETGPAAFAIKFVQGREERLAGNDVHVEAGRVMIPICILKRMFGPALLRDPKLLAREARESVRIFCVFGHEISSLIRPTCQHVFDCPDRGMDAREIRIAVRTRIIMRFPDFGLPVAAAVAEPGVFALIPGFDLFFLLHFRLTQAVQCSYFPNRLISHWVNYLPDQLNSTFAALSDPTRRAILARLLRGDLTVKELGEPFPITAPSMTKHLKVLERAGLITRSRDAQRRPCGSAVLLCGR